MDKTASDALIQGYVDNTLSTAEFELLEELLQQDQSFAQRFTDIAHVSAYLEQRAASGDSNSDALQEVEPADGTPLPAPVPKAASHLAGGTWIGPALLGSAVLGTLLFSLGVFSGDRGIDDAGQMASLQAVCEAFPSKGLKWKPGHEIRGSLLSEDARVLTEGGRLRLVFRDGTEIVTQGVVDLTIKNRHLVDLQNGVIAVTVNEPSKRKFRVVTPSSRILDLGTRFGVSVSDSSVETEVVVFQGAVELEPVERVEGSPPQILEAGDSVRIMPDLRMHRVVSVQPGKYPVSPGTGGKVRTSVIRSIQDNLKDQDTHKGYRVVPGGFREDALAYVDRMDEWNGLTSEGLPEFLLGADYIMPFMEGRHYARLRMQIEVRNDAYIYLLVDDSVAPSPWVLDSFDDTGHDIGLDQGYTLTDRTRTASGPGASIDKQFSVYRTSVTAGSSVELKELSSDTSQVAMYGVCVAAIDRPEVSSDLAQSTLITSVTDNIRGRGVKGYHVFINGMRENALAYADRLHEWNGVDESGIPEEMIDADLVITNNDDRFIKGYQLRVEVAEEADVFLMWDKRAPIASWVIESFVDTGWTVGLDEGITPRAEKPKSDAPGKSIDAEFSVWRMRCAAGSPIEFGSIGTSDRHTNMYGVCIKRVEPGTPSLSEQPLADKQGRGGL